MSTQASQAKQEQKAATESKVLQNYAEEIKSDSLPPPRFGHTVNLVSKTSIVIFGGAISTKENPNSYTMTADLYMYNIPANKWKKLEVSQATKSPHVRAAHASATVRDNQVLYYGGSIGNGQYATEDLWFLDIKNHEEANWMQVPIEGQTPGSRYGHSMIYIYPNLILFGGSSFGSQNQKNLIMKDVWIFPTDKTPFRWIKIETGGNVSPSARLYHTANVYLKYNGEDDAMVLYGGRDLQNSSLKDLCILTKVKQNSKEYYKWELINHNPSGNDNKSHKEIGPVGRHQHSSTIFGPFLFVMGGRNSSGQLTTFDVFSFVSNTWHRFGTVGLFRHTIWVYFNEPKNDSLELYLYIYGGFDSEHNPEINSKLYRINIQELFSKNETLSKELNDYLTIFLKKNSQVNSKNKAHFELNSKVVVYNIPEENNFSTLIKEISYTKLTEVDKKISDHPAEIVAKEKEYDEESVKSFLQLLPPPDQEFNAYSKGDDIIELRKNLIKSLISDLKNVLIKLPSVIKVKSPVKIFGSINGHYNDLLRYFTLFGRPSELKGDIECVDYLFLGNFTNRGAFSLETLCLLFSLKLKYPTNFHLIRGSMEDIDISNHYGLAEECIEKLNEKITDPNSIYVQLCDLFDYLPIAAVINNQILCVHSGIPSNLTSLKELENIKKPYKIKENQIAQQILWSTPVSKNSISADYSMNNVTTEYRKYHYDENSVNKLFKNTGLKMIIRSHDVTSNGIQKMFNDKVITIFSATNYCGTYQNNGAIILIKKSYEMQPKILTWDEKDSNSWLKDNWSKTEYPPSPKKDVK